ncbi:MAG: 2-hydroxyacid dehydrogenase [Burkholderiales bacterium]|nr:2-hydroxyacid dehydrogenase [Burkholderiales bacterium]
MADTILLATRLPLPFHAALAERYEVLGPLAPPFGEAAAALPDQDAARVRAIVSIGSVGIPAESLGHFPNLGLIACLGSGYEGVPVTQARARGVAVTHSPGANAAAVADLAFGLLIAAMRDLHHARNWLREGHFAGNAGRRLPAAPGLTGRRMGIYGLGAIGQKIARRAEAFEMEVAYHNRRPRGDVSYRWMPDLAALAQWADVLMIAVRADASNRHSVGAPILAALGPQGYVVNISRGPVVDEAALVDALRHGRVAGAGLDVFEHEPEVTPALFDLPRVALTPHIGGNTEDAQSAMHDMVLDNLAAFFAGRTPPHPVPA